MKKFLLSAAVAFFALTGVQAQVGFGLKGGLNISNLGGDDVDDDAFKSLFGANAGIYASVPVSKTFFVQPELSFSMEGAKVDGIDDAALKLNYINLPVMLKYQTMGGFFVEAGPQVGLLLSARAKDDDVNLDVKEGFNTANISVGGGLGYKLDESLSVGARYMLGVRSIAKEDDVKTTANTLSVNLFYTFGK